MKVQQLLAVFFFAVRTHMIKPSVWLFFRGGEGSQTQTTKPAVKMSLGINGPPTIWPPLFDRTHTTKKKKAFPNVWSFSGPPKKEKERCAISSGGEGPPKKVMCD